MVSDDEERLLKDEETSNGAQDQVTSNLDFGTGGRVKVTPPLVPSDTSKVEVEPRDRHGLLQPTHKMHQNKSLPRTRLGAESESTRPQPKMGCTSSAVVSGESSRETPDDKATEDLNPTASIASPTRRCTNDYEEANMPILINSDPEILGLVKRDSPVSPKVEGATGNVHCPDPEADLDPISVDPAEINMLAFEEEATPVPRLPPRTVHEEMLDKLLTIRQWEGERVQAYASRIEHCGRWTYRPFNLVKTRS